MSDESTSDLERIQTAEQKIASLEARLEQISKAAEGYLSAMENLKKETIAEKERLTAEISSGKSELQQAISTELSTSQQTITQNLTQATKKISDEIAAASAKIDAHLDTEKKAHSTAAKAWQESSTNALDEFKAGSQDQLASQEENFSELKAKIESLLPEASAVGVSQAFAKEKRVRYANMAFNLSLSYACIFFIFYIAYFFYQENSEIFLSIFNYATGKSDYPAIAVTFLKLLTLEAPLCWLATFAAKKAHQHQRIYEEYAHKYTAAMTYVGLCKETREHPDIYGQEAVKNLANGFRDAVFRNPSAEIDKKVESGSPLELAETLVKKVGQTAAEAMISKKSQS